VSEQPRTAGWPTTIAAGAIIGAIEAVLAISLAALVVFWLIIDRTTLGYGVRAVGANPEAARYGGINVARNYFLAMAISGVFAGLAGAIDILGWQYRFSQIDIQASSIGFAGIARPSSARILGP